MFRNLSKSIWLLLFSVGICCVIYPVVLWLIGQIFFPFQANGSILRGLDGGPVGSRLIAQPFTKDEYFQPRPSAAAYDASASASSTLAASNYLLRDRVGRTLGPIVRYRSGANTGRLVAPEIERWFQGDVYQGSPHIVAQWADLHNGLAQAWVKADPAHSEYVDNWTKTHPNLVAQWGKDNPATPHPKAVDLAVIFFENFSKETPADSPLLSPAQGPMARLKPRLNRLTPARTFKQFFLICGDRSILLLTSRMFPATSSPLPALGLILISRCKMPSISSIGSLPNGLLP